MNATSTSIPANTSTTTDPSLIAAIQALAAAQQQANSVLASTAERQETTIQLMAQTARATAASHSNDTKWSNMKAEKFQQFTSRSKFESWFESVEAILCTKDWRNLYDKINEMPKTVTTPDLVEESNILYSHLKKSIKGELDNLFLDSAEYRGKGLEFLDAIRRECRPRLTHVQKNRKINELGNICRGSNETVVQYSVRVRRLYKELKYNGYTADSELLRLNFINGLGKEFTTIHSYLDYGDQLPPYLDKWETNDLKNITILAREYLKTQTSRYEDPSSTKSSHSTPAPTKPKSNQQNPSGDTAPREALRQSSNRNTNPTSSTSANIFNNLNTPYLEWQKYIKILISRGEYTTQKENELQQVVNRKMGNPCCVFHLNPNHTSQQCITINNYLTLTFTIS